MYSYAWYHWISFFFIYSFFGWIIESGYVSLRRGHFVNRGFLRLPLLPLYGAGAVVLLLLSIPFRDNPVMVFFVGMIGATLLEYVTGYVMERLFKVKYWDYSNVKFNINGYVCLSASLVWGALAIFLTYFIHEPIARFVVNLNPWVEGIALVILVALFVADSIASVIEALHLEKDIEAMTKMKKAREEAQARAAQRKAEVMQRVEERKEAWEASYAEQNAAEPEDVERPIHKMGFYRRSLLKGNPSASSARFSEALEELKRSLDKKDSD